MKRYFHQAASAVRGLLANKRFIRSAGVSAALLVICGLPLAWPSPHDPNRSVATDKAKDSEVPDPKTQSTRVAIYSTSRARWVAWPAPDAIKFSLDQLVTTIRYLFAAAAVGLAFVGKIVIEPRLSSSSLPLPLPVQYALIAASLFWIGSITSGMLAHLFLDSLGTSHTFAMSGPVSVCLMFQLAYFALALWLFVVALVNSL